MENMIIIAVLAVILVYGIWATVKHFRGQGACCGGGSGTVREVKRLDAPKLGTIEILIEGMHCDNCRNSVERAINRFDGAACEVNLRKKKAVVSYSKEQDLAAMKAAVEKLGFKVKEMKKC